MNKTNVSPLIHHKKRRQRNNKANYATKFVRTPRFPIINSGSTRVQDLNGGLTLSGTESIHLKVKQDTRNEYYRLRFNPLFFRSLIAFAKMYTHFKFLRMEYDYRAEAPAVTTSVVTLGFTESYIAADSSILSMDFLKSHYSGNASKNSGKQRIELHDHRSHYAIMSAEGKANSEKSLQGVLQYLAHNGTAGTIVGQLHLHYVIQFENRIINADLDPPTNPDENYLVDEFSELNI